HCWPLVASNIRSRQRRSMPSLVICTPSTGCSSSSSSEYSFDLRNIVPSDSRHRKTRHTGINRRKKDLQFLLSIRVVAGALLRSGPATSKRSAAASSRLVRCPRSDTAGEKRSKSRADTTRHCGEQRTPYRGGTEFDRHFRTHPNFIRCAASAADRYWSSQRSS